MPLGVVTAIGPLPMPGGWEAVIWVSVLTVNVAATPLNVTLVAPVKDLPVITMLWPARPEVGEKLSDPGGLLVVTGTMVPRAMAPPSGRWDAIR